MYSNTQGASCHQNVGGMRLQVRLAKARWRRAPSPMTGLGALGEIRAPADLMLARRKHASPSSADAPYRAVKPLWTCAAGENTTPCVPT